MNRVLAAAARSVSLGAALGAALLSPTSSALAQTLLDPALTVTTVASGLSQPIAMAFIGDDDILVTEKATGRVRRVTGGVITGTVLDLAVNSNSERGLLGIALHPNFPATPYVYLYNTESTTGADSTNVAEVPLLGNRVDRFVWNGSTLTFDRNIIQLRSFQNDWNRQSDPTFPNSQSCTSRALCTRCTAPRYRPRQGRYRYSSFRNRAGTRRTRGRNLACLPVHRAGR